jgi:ribosome-binding protein aMBF1 (putative translation factor)
MCVTSTAKRRRRQAVNRFRHLARIGRGNNNRSYFTTHSNETYDKRAAAAREKRLMMQARLAKRRR